MIPMRKYEYVIIRNDKEIGINEYGFDYLLELEKENKQLKEKIEWYEKENKHNQEIIIKDTKVLDEIREYIDKEFYTIQGEIVIEPDDILQILDKVKE